MIKEASSVTGPKPLSLSTLLARVLQSGAWLSVLLVTIGFIVILVRGEEHGALTHSKSASRLLFHTPGVTLVSIGMIVLVATPVLRESMALGWFARLRDWTFVWLCAAVLTLVVVSLIVGAL